MFQLNYQQDNTNIGTITLIGGDSSLSVLSESEFFARYLLKVLKRAFAVFRILKFQDVCFN